MIEIVNNCKKIFFFHHRLLSTTKLYQQQTRWHLMPWHHMTPGHQVLPCCLNSFSFKLVWNPEFKHGSNQSSYNGMLPTLKSKHNLLMQSLWKGPIGFAWLISKRPSHSSQLSLRRFSKHYNESGLKQLSVLLFAGMRVSFSKKSGNLWSQYNFYNIFV